MRSWPRRLCPWVPVALAAVWLASPTADRAPAVPPPPGALVHALGRLPAARIPGPGTTFHLAADSYAHFTVTGLLGIHEARSTDLSATLAWGEGMPASFACRIDLHRLRDADDRPVAEAAHHVLGILADAMLTYDGRLDRCEWLPGGLARATFRGVASLGMVSRPLCLELWLWASGGVVQAQALATVAHDVLRLPRRYMMGVFPEDPDLTLGLDLTFRADSDH